MFIPTNLHRNIMYTARSILLSGWPTATLPSFVDCSNFRQLTSLKFKLNYSDSFADFQESSEDRKTCIKPINVALEHSDCIRTL